MLGSYYTLLLRISVGNFIPGRHISTKTVSLCKELNTSHRVSPVSFHRRVFFLCFMISV